jgi:hypothetical protein
MMQTRQRKVQKLTKNTENIPENLPNLTSLPLRLPTAMTTFPNRFSKPKTRTNNLDIRNTNFHFHLTRPLVTKGERDSLQVQKQRVRQEKGEGNKTQLIGWKESRWKERDHQRKEVTG